MNQRPPKIAEKILKKLLYDDVWKTTLGDFEEYYLYLLEQKGKKAANAWYWKQVMHYAPSKLIHKCYWSIAMFYNYLKVAFRNLRNNKSYSFINIIGLSTALVCVVFIGLFINYELSYDDYHPDADRTYMIVLNNPGNEYMGSTWFSLTPSAMAPTLKEEFPEVERSSHLARTSSVMETDEITLNESGISADFDFFQMFSFDWVSGNRATALDDPGSIILTQSIAERLFPNTNPMGESVTLKFSYSKDQQKTVTGVIKDVPGNSIIDFNYVTKHSSSPYYKYNFETWSNTNEYTFVTLSEGSSSEEFEQKLAGFKEKYMLQDQYFQNNPGRVPSLHIMPLNDLHLNSGHLNFMIGNSGNMNYIYLFTAIAILILLIASVNYMNLATARSLTRAKEVGVRKVIGAYRSNLIMQFTSEAVVISIISLLISAVIILVFYPAFGNTIGLNISKQVLTTFEFWGILILLALFIGVISGSYPSLFMSALKPAFILKNQTSGGRGNRFIRNILVVSQFTITIILVIGSIVVFSQLNYIKSMNTGLNRDQVVSISIQDPAVQNGFDKTLGSELRSNPNILELSTSQMNPIRMSSRTTGTTWEGQQDGEELAIYVSPIGNNFLEMFDLEVLAGRAFSADMLKESTTDFILNETAVRELGWSPDEAIGKQFNVWGNDGEIVGVVKDFNYLSLYQSIEPLVLLFSPESNQRFALARISSSNIEETLSFIENTFKEVSPGYPYSYNFLDESFANEYQADIRMGTVFTYFTIIAFIIASLGLFGLATFVTEQKTKEIGIRKVLGADVIQIISLLNKDFLLLVLISFIIAAPAGWYVSEWWLEDFAFRINIGPVIFIISALLTFGVALITVSLKSVSIALSNPVDSLRSE